MRRGHALRTGGRCATPGPTKRRSRIPHLSRRPISVAIALSPFSRLRCVRSPVPRPSAVPPDRGTPGVRHVTLGKRCTAGGTRRVPPPWQPPLRRIPRAIDDVVGRLGRSVRRPRSPRGQASPGDVKHKQPPARHRRRRPGRKPSRAATGTTSTSPDPATRSLSPSIPCRFDSTLRSLPATALPSTGDGGYRVATARVRARGDCWLSASAPAGRSARWTGRVQGGQFLMLLLGCLADPKKPVS